MSGSQSRFGTRSIEPVFLDILREHRVALALIDQSLMPRPHELFERFDPITTDFTHVRWLGDRKEIERQTKTWDKVIVDRTQFSLPVNPY